ncbi:aldo/keto reductase [Paracoccus onubensis]|uniref:Aldo/keto reductase n=1 Tax=Paracoccus onubensis TaxID=1675788 RepID=A0A418T7T8_9RHOB|nr:aldo/keto reductase [Paracoccus onubensis]RJE89272.1 aldo/keto reductase [Paracoccus onubensis]
MQKRRLGQDGPMIGAVALGTMNFVGAYGPADPEESLRCMAACLEMGVDHFDTSNVYGMGRAEELLSRFLKDHGDRVVLASKCGITRNPDHPFDNSPTHMRQSLDASLKRLGVEHIHLYYLHRHEAARPIEEIMETLLKFRDEGKIGAIGLSEIAPSTLERAAAVGPVAAVQSEYSLWTRQPELGILQGCARHDAALVAFSPIARGVLSDTLPEPKELGDGDIRLRIPRFNGENWPRNLIRLRAFREYAHDNGHSPATLAIAWVLSRGPHVIALPGSRSIAHMQENAHGGTITLTSQQLEEIERILPVGWAHGPRYGEELSKGPEGYC